VKPKSYDYYNEKFSEHLRKTWKKVDDHEKLEIRGKKLKKLLQKICVIEFERASKCA